MSGTPGYGNRVLLLTECLSHSELIDTQIGTTTMVYLNEGLIDSESVKLALRKSLNTNLHESGDGESITWREIITDPTLVNSRAAARRQHSCGCFHG